MHSPLCKPKLVLAAPRNARRRDHRIRTAVHRALCSQGYPSLWNLHYEVSDGAIVLHSVVPTYYLRQAAQITALAVGGLERVKNLVEVI